MPELADTDQQWPVVSSRDLHRDDWVMALREDLVARPGAEGGSRSGAWCSSTPAPR